MYRAANAYLQTDVSTTSPGELVIMLYDGAIKFLTRAKVLIDAKDVAGKGIAISKALDIINELSSTLNKEKGGELAENLHKLYFLCSTKLAMANLKQDKAIIDSVIKILTGLRSAYAQIQGRPEVQEVSAQLASKQKPDQATARSMINMNMGQTMAQTQQANMRGRAAYSKVAGAV
ncbi:flagellar export chaperone FliS [Desulfovibrio sp. OttesenSCG-928-C06]|nr:flagellar export chaperone FliS [Desulfovibrio sp. OttesenSCG-928-C06]